MEVEWVRALWGARKRLCEKQGRRGLSLMNAAAECKEWTLPVLYARRTSFRFKRMLPGAPSPLQGELEGLRRLRIGLIQLAQIPEGAIQMIDARIAVLEAQLQGPGLPP